MNIRLMLVDDHEVVRLGLRTLFGQAANIEVVAEAGTVAEAIAEAARAKPDVVLMDMRLPDGTGVDACREIRSANALVHVLFLTSYSDEEAVLATILAGAAGYLLKEIDPQALLGAIARVAIGETILDPKMTETALNALTRTPLQAKSQNPDALSIQESRVLALVVEGKTNKEIAARLGLSDKTVKNYLSNAFQKLGVNRRAHAAALYSSLRPKP
jgi:two-component system, NarL family, response regulator DevR